MMPISSHFYSIFPGLIGLIAGLAMRKFQNFRDTRTIFKAIGFYLAASILLTIVSGWMFGYLGYISLGSIIIGLIIGSIFLTILMIAFAKIVRPAKNSE